MAVSTIASAPIVKAVERELDDMPKSNDNQANQVEANRTRRHLLDLPQEIQDMIFDYAYSPEDGEQLEFKSQADWEREELDYRLNDITHSIRPFPEPRVSMFLVSKLFFIAAAQAYARNHTFDGYVMLGSYFDVYGFGGLLAEFVTCLDVDYSFIKRDYGMGMLPRLKNLNISLAPGDMQDLAPKLPWEQDLTDDELSRSEGFEHIIKLNGIRDLTIKSKYEYFDDDRQSTWERNIERLGELVKSHVTKPKVLSNRYLRLSCDFQPGQPLYATSVVRFGASELRKEPGNVSETAWLPDGLPVGAAGDMAQAVEKSLEWLVDSDPSILTRLLLSRAGAPQGSGDEHRADGDDGMPDETEGILAMVANDPAAVVKWIQSAKTKLKQADGEELGGHLKS